MSPPLFFARKPFTHDTYRDMASGFAQHRSLFGPRRIGKSWWLLYDLGPKAEQYGHRTVYVDFWDRGPAPLALLLYELDQALSRQGGAGGLLARAQKLAPRVRLSALGTAVSLDLSQQPKALPEDQILLLDQYLARLANEKKPCFLFLDEFQEITKSSGHGELMAALRAGLNRHAGGFATVFTGSSQSRLQRVFSSRTAPFYRFASPLVLPQLGSEFVRHQLQFYPDTAPAVSADDGLGIFDRLGRNPDYFQRWMRHRAVTPDLTHAEIATMLEQDLAEDLDHERIWLALKDIDRLVLRVVAEEVSEIYGDAARDRYGALSKDTPPGSSAIQTAFKKLQNRDLVDVWDNNRQIADPVFQSWILARPEDDFR